MDDNDLHAAERTLVDAINAHPTPEITALLELILMNNLLVMTPAAEAQLTSAGRENLAAINKRIKEADLERNHKLRNDAKATEQPAPRTRTSSKSKLK